jgi:hypothetical protein
VAFKPLFSAATFAISLLTAQSTNAQPLRDYRCTIERVTGADMDRTDAIQSRARLYVGREFTADRRTGLMAGALKNSYVTRPEVIDYGSSENSFKVVTTLRLEQGAGRGTNVYLLVVNEYKAGPKKPFLFVDNDQVYSGNCVHF